VVVAVAIRRNRFSQRGIRAVVEKSMDDERLLAAYRAGRDEAATELFERYYQRLIELIRRQSGWRLKQAEGSTDVAQSVLRSFFEQIRSRPIEIESDDGLWPLLATITLNKIRNRGKFWQRKQRDPTRMQPLEAGADPLESGPSAEDAVVLEDMVQRLLEPFSDRRRRILEGILAGQPVNQIAVQVGSSERTVLNTRLAAARILEQILAGE
jgi:DNA-directed RNA polymerase specialized sigma24 family protein